MRPALRDGGDGPFYATRSPFEGHGTAAAMPVPVGAAAARVVADWKALHRLLRRADQLASSLPHELLRAHELAVAKAPDTTEAVRLQRIRIGQDLFRAGLLDYWEGRCAITGLAVPALLRASHIKPWADCATDAERLDVFNGLLLAAHLDAAFDQGYLTIADDGSALLAADLRPEDRALLGLDRPPGRARPRRRPPPLPRAPQGARVP